MAPIHYSLHYEDYPEHLMSRFGKLLQLQSLVDMTLMCSSHTLRVHKAVLAASSAYFQEVLQKQTGEPLIILKMRFSVLKSLVEFMYCGKTQCLEENLDELVSAAKFLKIKGLSKVTKEGLGINNSSELPVFTPPVVINRPPQSIIDLHAQDNTESNQPLSQLPPVSGPSQPLDAMGRSNPDMVVRMPFDIENGGGTSGVDYVDTPRAVKPRRGRPTVRRTLGWEGAGPLGRAAERALLRREQDSRKAIHHLKHLQSRHMQDYMDRVTLSQAVNSICGPESATSHNYMNIDNDLMYVDQNVSPNVLNSSLPYLKEQVNETITSSYSNTNTTNSVNETVTSGISTAMTQYVNALKNAGLPTDLPILFESGDGSYINVNEQVLLDMVQSNEIQYEVIDQPNIIEKVSDASEIKSIDDLSKSIERGEMLMTNKPYVSNDNFGNESSQFNRQEDTINSLNAILPDNLESFVEQQNYVVLDPRLQHSHNAIDPVSTNDFSCIDGDMQFFTKSMSDDVKKYYDEHQLSDPRMMDHFCPTSTTLENNFSMSLLNTKSSHISSNKNQQFNSPHPEDIRRNEDCYDFGLQLSQTSDFKDENLHCLMSSSKEKHDRSSYNDSIELEKTTRGDDIAAQARDEIMKDLMNLENKIGMEQSKETAAIPEADKIDDSNTEEIEKAPFKTVDNVRNTQQNGSYLLEPNEQFEEKMTANITSNDMQWQESYKENDENNAMGYENHVESNTADSQNQESVIDLSERMKSLSDQVSTVNGTQELCKELSATVEKNENINATLDENIPFAVGLLPLKQVQSIEDENILKRKKSVDLDLLDNLDAKCLKRNVKYKNL